MPQEDKSSTVFIDHIQLMEVSKDRLAKYPLLREEKPRTTLRECEGHEKRMRIGACIMTWDRNLLRLASQKVLHCSFL
jgi:hypothetical protein